MANVLGTLFGDIADAIREKSGSTGTMKPAAFPDAIRAIEAGGGSGETEILALTTLEGFVLEGDLAQIQTAADYALTIGQTYFVVWDGSTFECVGQDMSAVVSGAVGLGDLTMFGGTGNGEPFLLGAADGTALYMATDDDPTHTVRIYQTGGSGDVRYVTFLSHDGKVFYGKKAVAVGDDCADPIVRGVFATPTRESTAQYDFTFAGWATVAGGGVNSSALKAVEKDRTLYANYTAAVRYYTVTYFDSDGVTVLKTETLAYGTTPGYAPEKDGFSFSGWTPVPGAVTGDAAYTASWSEKITFANGTWADIVRIAEVGEAQNHFALGDTREFTYTAPDGSTIATTLRIIGFDTDDLSDGSGKAAVTIMSVAAPFKMAQTTTGVAYSWATSHVRTALNGSVLESFPAALQSGIKSVSKQSRKYIGSGTKTGLLTTSDKVWLPSAREYGLYYDIANYSIYPEKEAHGYSGITAKSIFTEAGLKSSDYLITRSGSVSGAYYAVRYTWSGSLEYWRDSNADLAGCVFFGFCI